MVIIPSLIIFLTFFTVPAEVLDNNAVLLIDSFWLKYFKILWSRFKRQSNLLEQGQTLYSFRHSGAIEIFKRTGSLTKLQKAMGHLSINVSLTYLRGLEVAKLKEEDMPMVL